MTRSVFTQRYKAIISLLVEDRVRLGVTQSELASRLNRPQSYISKYESCDRRIDIIELIDIIEAMGLTASETVHEYIRKLNTPSANG